MPVCPAAAARRTAGTGTGRSLRRSARCNGRKPAITSERLERFVREFRRTPRSLRFARVEGARARKAGSLRFRARQGGKPVGGPVTERRPWPDRRWGKRCGVRLALAIEHTRHQDSAGAGRVRRTSAVRCSMSCVWSVSSGNRSGATHGPLKHAGRARRSHIQEMMAQVLSRKKPNRACRASPQSVSVGHGRSCVPGETVDRLVAGRFVVCVVAVC